MLVGGVATVFHGHVRTTQQLDLWVQETPENKACLVKALKAANVPSAETYMNIEMIPGWSALTIGDSGFVAYFMGYTKAFGKKDFDACYERATSGDFDSIPITVIQLNDLITEKSKLARPKDLEDVEHLKRISSAQNKSKSPDRSGNGGGGRCRLRVSNRTVLLQPSVG